MCRYFTHRYKVQKVIFILENVGKNKYDISQLRAGFELKQTGEKKSEQEIIFKFLDTDNNGIIDDEELKKFIEEANTNGDETISDKEILKLLNKDRGIKDLKIKKKSIAEFLALMQESTENVDNVHILIENGAKKVIINYKEGELKQKTVYGNGEYETFLQNEAGESICELHDRNDLLLKKEIKNAEQTEITEYEPDGQTPAKVTLETAPNKKTVTEYENKLPTTRIVTENNSETTYMYNAKAQTFEKTKEISNKGHDALEKTTVYNPLMGVKTQIVNDNGVKRTTTFLDNEFISRTSESSTYTEETKFDNVKEHGFITNRTYKKGGTSVCYSNTEDLNTRTYEKLEINGRTFEAEYDGQGNTFVVVQYGETFRKFCERMGFSETEIREANKDNPQFKAGRQGSTVIVPGYIAPNSDKISNRKSAQKVQELIRKEYSAKRDIAQVENEKTEIIITLQDAKFKKDYKWEAHQYPKDMDWKWVAKWLYTKEGASKINDYQVEQRAKILQKLNPDIKNGEIYGKPINVKYDTSQLELQEEQRKQVPFRTNSKIHTFRDLAIDIWKQEHPNQMYFDYYGRLEIGYREQLLREMNPDVQDGQLAGKTLKATILNKSGSYQAYKRNKADQDIGNPVVKALLVNKGEHSQAKLNALSRITTKEEFESYVRCAEGQQYRNHKLETWLNLIPEEDRDTIIQKWYRQGILEDSDLVRLQANKAYWAIRSACDGLNIFSNSEEIRQAIKLITDPTGQNNPEFAKQVYDAVDTRIRKATERENIWSGKTFNLKEYIQDEWWVTDSDEDNYRLNLTAQGTQELHVKPLAGETQEQAVSRERVQLASKTFKSATIGAGTNEHSMEDVLKFLNNKDEFIRFKNSIQGEYTWNGYKDVVQYVLYDELSLDEIGRINELMISKGFYSESEANEIRAFYKVQVLKDGNTDKIQNAFRTISSQSEFNLINAQVDGGFVKYVRTNPKLASNADIVLASAGKYLSRKDQINTAYNLLSGKGVFFLNENVVSSALNCIQSEEVAQAVNAKLRQHNTSIDKLRKEYCLNEVTRVSDRPLMEATVPARLSARQIEQNKETVKIFEAQLADFEAQYNAVKDSEGALSEFIDGYFNTVGISVTGAKIEELIAYDKETLQYLKLASEGRLDQFKNGARENISLEEVIKLRANNISRLSGAKSVSRTTNEAKVGATNKEIAQMAKDMELLAYENECRSSLLTSWNYISKVDENSSNADLSKAVEDTIANLNSFVKSEGMEFTLPVKYMFEDEVIKDRETKEPVDSKELMTLVKDIRGKLSEITKEMLGTEIPANTSYFTAKSIFDKVFKNKKKSVTSTYEKAYGRAIPENLLEKHSKYIGYGKMFVQIASTIVVTIGTSIATGGSGTALFLTAAGTSLAMGSIDGITSANGITKAQGDEIISGALWDGLLTLGGFKVGSLAEKFVHGEFRIARGVLATNTKTVRKIAPALSTKSTERVAILMARAEAAGIEVTSDTLQSLLQQYCMNGEINEEGFIMALLMSAGGNTIGHAISARGDIKIKAKSKTTPLSQGMHTPVEIRHQQVFDKPVDNYLMNRDYYKKLIPDITDDELDNLIKQVEFIKNNKNVNYKDIVFGDTDIDRSFLNKIRERINKNGAETSFEQYTEKISGGKDITKMTDNEITDYYKTLVPFISDEELTCLKNQIARIKNGEPRFLNTPEERQILSSIEAKMQVGLRLKGITNINKANSGKFPKADIPFEDKHFDSVQESILNSWIWTAPTHNHFDGIFDEMSTTINHDTYLYRGVTIRHGMNEGVQVDFLNTIKEGEIIDNSGRYTSNAGDFENASSYSNIGSYFGQRYTLKIKVPKGTKVIDARNADSALDEFILPSHKLQIKSIDYKTGVVECEYIPAEPKIKDTPQTKPTSEGNHTTDLQRAKTAVKPAQIHEGQLINTKDFESQMTEIVGSKNASHLSENLKDADGNIPQDLVDLLNSNPELLKRVMIQPRSLFAGIKSLKNGEGHYTKDALDFIKKEMSGGKNLYEALVSACAIKKNFGELTKHNIEMYNDISTRFNAKKERIFELFKQVPAKNQKAVLDRLADLQNRNDFEDIINMISTFDRNKTVSTNTIENALNVVENTNTYTRARLDDYIKSLTSEVKSDDIPFVLKLIDNGMESTEDIALGLAYIKLNKIDNVANINFNELENFKKLKITKTGNNDFAINFYKKCMDNSMTNEQYFDLLTKYKENYEFLKYDEIQDMIIKHPNNDYEISRLNNSKNFFSVTENKPDSPANEIVRYQYSVEDDGALTYLCKETETLKKGNTVLKTEYPDGTVKKGYYEDFDESLQFSNFTLEETIGANGIRTSRTISKPSKTEKGVTVTLQEIYDSQGNVIEVREIGKLTHYGSKKQGLKIEREYVSPSGVKSTQTIIEGPNGTYSKFESAGVEVTRKFRKINENNVTVTQINGEKYNAKFDNDKIEITRIKPDGSTEVKVLDSELLDLSLMNLYKQVPGDYLFKLKELGIKVKRGYNANNACYDTKNRTIRISDEQVNDLFTFAHEFGHVMDFEVLNKLSGSEELRDVYTRELNKLYKEKPGMSNKIISYFTDDTATHLGRSANSGLEEIIAEVNGISSGLLSNESNHLQRAKLLQENFPETAAYILKKIKNATV